ncbi:MAG TPA: 30S ribosomal protein S4 [candidate division WWE3 bacterium]|uniref:Small ribosomal subunit protein uS4 n=1 Tax=candidate division WWE3 bacterium TaxID=2053526 RepID=A0A7C1DJ07_UNCKA|nr:30S ribosomal protein S4 [candidate division WWE3 bacterium]
MARIIGPKCRICRQLGVKLNLKGTRCDSEKCAMTKRPYSPGQHGNSRRRSRASEYGDQLREKQKAKNIYGVLEHQFKNYVTSALKMEGVSGENLFRLLESRLDNLVYRSGFSLSRPQARQLIRAGVFTVNDKKVLSPSYRVKAGDILKPVDFSKVHLREGFVLPEWISANVKERYIKMERDPVLEDFGESFEIQQIIDFYSR